MRPSSARTRISSFKLCCLVRSLVIIFRSGNNGRCPKWIRNFSEFCFLQEEDGIRYYKVTEVQTCALPICCTLRRLHQRDTTEIPAPVLDETSRHAPRAWLSRQRAHLASLRRDGAANAKPRSLSAPRPARRRASSSRLGSRRADLDSWRRHPLA